MLGGYSVMRRRHPIASSVGPSGSEFKKKFWRIREHARIFDGASESSSRKASWSRVGGILIVVNSE
jgi:hypothetical protein